jgi:hypothetical protein
LTFIQECVILNTEKRKEDKKMKINHLPATKFEDVQAGEVFYSYDEESFFIKTLEDVVADDYQINAVQLDNGTFAHFFPSEEVRIYPKASLNLE